MQNRSPSVSNDVESTVTTATTALSAFSSNSTLAKQSDYVAADISSLVSANNGCAPLCTFHLPQLSTKKQ
eukprot:9802325-Ditylum_brightwellii.AAC.1